MKCGMETPNSSCKSQGDQFRLCKGHGDKEECDWYQNLFCVDLDHSLNHNADGCWIVSNSRSSQATTVAQDVMYLKRPLESINLRVGLPMFLEVDNKGAVDSINNYSVGGRTCHMETRQYYLRELKDLGVMLVNWKACIESSSDQYTKSSARKNSRSCKGICWS